MRTRRTGSDRVRVFRQVRRDPVTGQARLSRNWMMRWTSATTGLTVVESTHTADRAEAEHVARAREADLVQGEDGPAP